MFDIKEGDTLMAMGEKSKGLAFIKDDVFYSLIDSSNNIDDKDE